MLSAQQMSWETKPEQEKGISIHDIVRMSGNWFIAYRNGIRQVQADENVGDITAQRQRTNGFVLKRSYFTLKKDLNSVFSVRYTQDLTVDNEGSDAGNVETRLKYLYVKARPELDLPLLSDLWIEGGMVHRPWLDYEQKINTYRVQDNMFIERNRIFNSADFGVTVGGNIGPKMDTAFLRQVNSAMPGKWLTYVFGLYNGGGYSGEELNQNKVFAARLSVRPLANTLPEVQLSGYFNVGRGNSEAAPLFNQVLGFAAYTGRHLTLTGQFHTGRGDFRARYVAADDPGISLRNEGYSFFGEYRLRGRLPFAFWGRYDNFTIRRQPLDDNIERIIGGITYRVNKNLRIIGNYEHNQRNAEKNDIYELNLEVTF